jgi:hypothetical protein
MQKNEKKYHRMMYLYEKTLSLPQIYKIQRT